MQLKGVYFLLFLVLVIIKSTNMKKFTLIISAILIATAMQAQFHFGPQIGYTGSKLTTNTSEITAQLKNNFMFGVFARIGEKVYVQPEVNWLTQGGIWEGATDNTKLEMTYKTVQIPVSLGWRMIDLKLVNIRIHGGFTANIATDKKIEITGITDPIDEADWKDLIWQYQVGAGVDVLMFALDVKYMGGLNELSKNDIIIDQNTMSTKSNMFVVTLGWKIF